MKSRSLPKSTFDFLTTLSKNNNRDWFNDNKDLYLKEYQHMINFADDLLIEMQKHDIIETASGKACLHRIYKDTRFSKDKVPYKTNWSGSFRRATKEKRGGYYFHLEPGNSFLAGGFFSPNAEDLKRIRQDIDYNYEDWNIILSSKKTKNSFRTLLGNQLTSSPKGFPKDHPAINLLRYKQFILKHRFTDEEVLSPGFINQISNTFQDLRPFFDHMSEILTTDANGISIL